MVLPSVSQLLKVHIYQPDSSKIRYIFHKIELHTLENAMENDRGGKLKKQFMGAVLLLISK